jgi:hypothetical protein
MWRDPIEEQIELALRPGAFMHDRACSSFVGGLEGVAAQIDELQKTDAVRAAGLYEAYLADWEDAIPRGRCFAFGSKLERSEGIEVLLPPGGSGKMGSTRCRNCWIHSGSSWSRSPAG